MKPHRQPHRGTYSNIVLDFDGAASYLNVTPRMVRKLVATRQLAHYKVGRLVRLTKADLDDYLARRRVAAAS